MSIGARIAKTPVCHSCGKRCYSKQSKAKAVARLLEAQEGVPFSVYRCGSSWHVGKMFKNRVVRSSTTPGDIAAGMGIDPGRTGAMALVNDQDLVIFDYASIEAADQAIRDIQDKYCIKFCVLERVWVRPKERNPSSVTKLIRSAAMWHTLLHIHGIPHEEYSPASWRRGIVSKNGKQAAVKSAQRIFESTTAFSRHDQAEAALMAYRAWRHFQAGWKTELKTRREAG